MICNVMFSGVLHLFTGCYTTDAMLGQHSLRGVCLPLHLPAHGPSTANAHPENARYHIARGDMYRP